MTLKEIEQLEPDKNGIITCMMEGVQRRFVKEVLISHINDNNHTCLFKIKKPAKQKKEVRKRAEKAVKVKGPDMRGKNGTIPIVAIFNDGTKKTFPSAASASLELSISRSDICRVAKGRYKQVKGFKFKYA